MNWYVHGTGYWRSESGEPFWGMRMMRTTRRRAIIAAAITGSILVLPGCFWPAPGAGPDRRAHNPFESEITTETVAALELLWETPTPGGQAGQPVTSNAGVHVSAGKVMYTFNRGTGSQLWLRDDPGYPTWSWMGPPNVADDLLWVGYGTTSFMGAYTTERVDPATGESVDSPGDDSGIVDGVRGTKYVLSAPGWGTDTPLHLRVTVGDVQDPDFGWSGIIDQRPDGSDLSALTLGAEFVHQAGHGVMDPVAGTFGNGVRGYSPDSPAPCFDERWVCPSWVTELDGTTATSPVLAADGSTLYTGTDAGTVYAVEASDGTVKWSMPVGSAVTAEPALADGSLYVPTASGRLVVLDAADGQAQWEADAGDNLGVQPAVAADVVYTGAADGTVNAFAAAGCGEPVCDPLWSASAGAGISGAPAINRGHLYVGAGSKLVAYALPDGAVTNA